MIVKKNFELKKYNTMRLNSIARIMYIPENIDELCDLVQKLNRKSEGYHILSGGSNVLINNNIDIPIVYMKRCNDILSYNRDTNIVECGCSVSLQMLINFMKDNKLGGIEFLYSVPGLVGGAVYMNAGRGRGTGLNISNYIEKVEYYDGKEHKIINKSSCEFEYRSSIFKSKNWVITKVYFNFPEQDSKITQDKINDRLAQSRTNLDLTKPSCGSIFSYGSAKIFKLLRGLRIGKAMYSSKTLNWISNTGEAEFSDIKKLIRIATFMHRLLFREIESEVIIWEE